MAARRRRTHQFGAVVGVGALVAAVVIAPRVIGSPDAKTPAATGPTPASSSPSQGFDDPTDSADPVLLRSTGFGLAPGQTFDSYTTKIRFQIENPVCDPILPGEIQPRLSYEPGVYKVALYAIAHDADGVTELCGGPTITYTVELLQPMYHRELVLDHSAPDNPSNAVLVPADATPDDYLDRTNPDTATWTSEDPVLSLWSRGVALECDPPVGYLSLLFPADGSATFEALPADFALRGLPPNAIDTRWRAGPVSLWMMPDHQTAFLVVNGHVQEWTYARPCVVDSFEHGRGG